MRGGDAGQVSSTKGQHWKIEWGVRLMSAGILIDTLVSFPFVSGSNWVRR